jgi:hypothetical protein
LLWARFGFQDRLSAAWNTVMTAAGLPIGDWHAAHCQWLEQCEALAE